MELTKNGRSDERGRPGRCNGKTAVHFTLFAIRSMQRPTSLGGLFVTVVLAACAFTAPRPVSRADDGWRKTAFGWEHSGGWTFGPLSPPTEPRAVPLGPGAVHPLPFAVAQLFCIAAAFMYLSRRERD